jgi:hypothetical protein
MTPEKTRTAGSNLARIMLTGVFSNVLMRSPFVVRGRPAHSAAHLIRRKEAAKQDKQICLEVTVAVFFLKLRRI